MFCPGCGSEYRAEILRCTDCDLPLVERLEPKAPQDVDLVQVLETTDSSFLPFARSVLDAAKIPHLVLGDEGLKLFPLGPAASNVTSRVLGARILVPREFESEARTLLESAAEPQDGPAGPRSPED